MAVLTLISTDGKMTEHLHKTTLSSLLLQQKQNMGLLITATSEIKNTYRNETLLVSLGDIPNLGLEVARYLFLSYLKWSWNLKASFAPFLLQFGLHQSPKGNVCPWIYEKLSYVHQFSA